MLEFIVLHWKNSGKAIKNKRPGFLSQDILLMRENTHPRVAKKMTNILLLQICHFLISPYSPDFALSDVILFTFLKAVLGTYHFKNDRGRSIHT